MLKSVDLEDCYGEIICKRISTRNYVTDECTVKDVSEIFITNDTLQAIGVTDSKCMAIGIIIRNELFSLIGQMYGRELYLNKSVRTVINNSDMIYYKRSTFSVIDELADVLKAPGNNYYILTDAEGKYKGIISTIKLNLFLSEMMTSELKAVKKVHSAIVKDEISVDTFGMSISGTVLAAGDIGGDFQYVKKIGGNKWFLSLCDVSGKGLNAGLVSVAVSSMYSVYDFSIGITELICTINNYIYSLFEGSMFLTGVFVEFDESTGEFDIYDMGHSMLSFFKNGRVVPLSNYKGNIPLGIGKTITPVKFTGGMDKGDILLFYTDGFHEQRNLDNENFGENKILSIVAKYRNSSPSQIKNILYDEVRSWRFGNAQGDDISLLILKYKGSSKY